LQKYLYCVLNSPYRVTPKKGFIKEESQGKSKVGMWVGGSEI
jgi:hypothetical protein